MVTNLFFVTNRFFVLCDWPIADYNQESTTSITSILAIKPGFCVPAKYLFFQIFHFSNCFTSQLLIYFEIIYCVPHKTVIKYTDKKVFKTKLSIKHLVTIFLRKIKTPQASKPAANPAFTSPALAAERRVWA